MQWRSRPKATQPRQPYSYINLRKHLLISILAIPRKFKLAKFALKLYIQPHSVQVPVFADVYCFSTAFNSRSTMVSTVGITAQTAPETAPKTATETAPKTTKAPIPATVLKASKETARNIAQQMSQECVARRLRQVNRTITRLYDEALRPHGLTVNQLNILAVVISEKQIRPGQLGQSLGMEKSTVSRTVDRMVRKDWLKVTPGTDGRTQLLTVTAKGRKLLLNVTPVWDNLQAGVLTDSGSGNNILQLLALDNESAEEPTSEAAEIYADEPVSADDFYL